MISGRTRETTWTVMSRRMDRTGAPGLGPCRVLALDCWGAGRGMRWLPCDEVLRSGLAGCAAQDPAPPVLQDDDGPEGAGVVGAAGDVLVAPAEEGIATQRERVPEAAGGERGVEAGEERGAEPAREGDGEAHLGAAEDLAREQAFCAGAEENLGAAGAGLD